MKTRVLSIIASIVAVMCAASAGAEYYTMPTLPGGSGARSVIYETVTTSDYLRAEAFGFMRFSFTKGSTFEAVIYGCDTPTYAAATCTSLATLSASNDDIPVTTGKTYIIIDVTAAETAGFTSYVGFRGHVTTSSTAGALLATSAAASIPTGINVILDTANTTSVTSQNYYSTVNMSPGSSSQPSSIGAATLPTTPGADLVGQTPTTIVTQPSFASLFGGYDQHVNHQASGIFSSPHAYIGGGSGGGHINIVGSASSFTTGDCENGSILGGADNWIQCLVTSSNLSVSNGVFGGSDNRIDGRNVSTGVNIIGNSVFGGTGNMVYGSSRYGVSLGGFQNGISIEPTFTSGNNGGVGNIVSGAGSLVLSADPGDGSVVAPSFAEATGLGARSWLHGMRCHAIGWSSGEVPTASSADAFGTIFAESQYCDLLLTNFRIQAGNTEPLFAERTGDSDGATHAGDRPFALEDGVWSIRGYVMCADRDLNIGTDQIFSVMEVDSTISIKAGESGNVAIFDSAGTIDGDDSVALTVISQNTQSGTYNAFTGELRARDGVTALDSGFDIFVTNTSGSSNSGDANCQAALGINMILEHS